MDVWCPAELQKPEVGEKQMEITETRITTLSGRWSTWAEWYLDIHCVGEIEGGGGGGGGDRVL